MSLLRWTTSPEYLPTIIHRMPELFPTQQESVNVICILLFDWYQEERLWRPEKRWHYFHSTLLHRQWFYSVEHNDRFRNVAPSKTTECRPCSFVLLNMMILKERVGSFPINLCVSLIWHFWRWSIRTVQCFPFDCRCQCRRSSFIDGVNHSRPDLARIRNRFYGIPLTSA